MPVPCKLPGSVQFKLSQHAKEEIGRRKIPLELVHAVLADPQQIVLESMGLKAFQSRQDFGGRMYLIRVIVDDSVKRISIVTVYRTSNIAKYWRKP